MRVTARIVCSACFATFALVSVGTASATATANLDGKVTKTDGIPVPGVAVSVMTTDGSSVGTGSTGLDGGYGITIDDSGRYDVRFTPMAGTGLSPLVVEGVEIEAASTLNVVLAPSGTASFSGVVRDSAGAPVEDVSVGLCDEVGELRFVRTAADGRFSFTRAPGSYCLSVRGGPIDSPTVAEFVRLEGSVELATSRTVDLTIASVPVTVRVQGPAGEPVVGARVHLYGDSTTPVEIAPGITIDQPYAEDYRTTDATGSATIRLFDRSTAQGSVTAPPDSDYAGIAIPPHTIDGPTTIAVGVLASASFSGVVRDSAGAPVEDVSVGLCDEVGELRFVRTAADGRFSFTRAPGSYCLSVRGGPIDSPTVAEFVRLEGSVELATSRTVDLTIASVPVTVRVQGPAGEPVVGARVHLYGDSTTPVEIAPGITIDQPYAEDYRTTDATGSATIRLFDRSTAQGSVTAPPDSDYAGIAIPPHTIDGPTTIAVGVLASASFSGVVRDSAGAPVEDVSVGLCDEVGELRFVRTAADGRFSFTRAPGSYCLSVRGGPIDSPTVAEFVRLEGSVELATSRTVDLTIASVPVTVRVQGPAGEPVVGARVHLYGDSTTPVEIAPGITIDQPYAEDYRTTDATGSATIRLFDRSTAQGSVTAPPDSDYAGIAIPPHTIDGPTTIAVAFVDETHPTDGTAPVIDLVNPVDGASYAFGAFAVADYSCVDEPTGSGLAACIGDISDGGVLDTTVSGTHTFTVTAVDNSGNQAVETVTYAVRDAPATMVDNLGEVVDGAFPDGGFETSLLAKLKSAIAAISEGNEPGACDALQSFVTHVAAHSGKKIPSDLARELIAAARSIQDEIGCS